MKGEGGVGMHVALESHLRCQFEMRLFENVSSPWSGESRSCILEFQEVGYVQECNVMESGQDTLDHARRVRKRYPDVGASGDHSQVARSTSK